jgi:hypothetical protein
VQQWVACKDHEPDCFVPLDAFEHVVRMELPNGDIDIQCENYGGNIPRPGCAPISTSLFDPIANQIRTEFIYDRACRIYGPCICQPVYFQNGLGEIDNYKVGDLVYSEWLRFKCVPGVTQPLGSQGFIPISILNGNFDGVTYGDLPNFYQPGMEAYYGAFPGTGAFYTPTTHHTPNDFPSAAFSPPNHVYAPPQTVTVI